MLKCIILIFYQNGGRQWECSIDSEGQIQGIENIVCNFYKEYINNTSYIFIAAYTKYDVEVKPLSTLKQSVFKLLAP